MSFFLILYYDLFTKFSLLLDVPIVFNYDHKLVITSIKVVNFIMIILILANVANVISSKPLHWAKVV